MKAFRRSLRVPFVLLLALVSVSPLWADDRTFLLTADVQLKIADAFLEEGEYYRAVTEYKKFLILFPDSAKVDYAAFQIGLAHFKGEEFGAAAHYFLALRKKYPGSGYAVQAGYREGVSYWRMKNFDRARITLAEIYEGYAGSEYAPRALAVAGLAALDGGRADISRLHLERFLTRYPDHPGVENVKETLTHLERYEQLPEKSPVLAGALSAVLPGSGYIYAERYGDGMTALLINGLFIAGAVTAIHHENYAVAAIVGGIGVPFYLGNIYGSANAARKWNLDMKSGVLRKIHASLAPIL